MRVTLKRDRDRPLEFDGKLLAEVSTRHRRKRWTELRLYQVSQARLAESKKWIAQEVARTTVTGEMDRHRAWCFDNEEEIRNEIGCGPLARQLYLEAGLDGVETLTNNNEN